MSSSYYRVCRACGARIQMREMPDGSWLAFDGRRRHACPSPPPPHISPTAPNSPNGASARWPWLTRWIGRIGSAIGFSLAVVYLGALVLILLAILVGTVVGTGMIAREAAIHVLAAAEATEPAELTFRTTVGSALAILFPAACLLVWRRSQPLAPSKR